MKQFVVASLMNDIGFVVTIKDDTRLEEAQRLAAIGFSRWNNPEKYPEYNDVGCAEPAMELLDEAGIEYEIDDFYEDDEETPKEEYKDLEWVDWYHISEEDQ